MQMDHELIARTKLQSPYHSGNKSNRVRSMTILIILVQRYIVVLFTLRFERYYIEFYHVRYRFEREYGHQ